jgi:hypothetical protein
MVLYDRGMGLNCPLLRKENTLWSIHDDDDKLMMYTIRAVWKEIHCCRISGSSKTPAKQFVRKNLKP